ncbi:MAG: PQQ-binding-like beta-propeller repeat protein [bacterium]|nr:PQQ-binding-like beta-propeller repeat protein [bacterium]
MFFALLLCVPQVSDAYGQQVAFCDDVDGDGRADIVVADESGEPWKEYVYSGVTGDLIGTRAEPIGLPPLRRHEGDFDGDGRADRVRVTGRGVELSSSTNPTPWWTFRPKHFEQRTRPGVRSAGDLDGDGAEELLFLDPSYDRRNLLGERYRGRVLAVSCKRRQILWTTTGSGYTSGIGRDAVPAGDVNLDGTPDVLTSTSAPFAGRLLCLSGASGRVLVQTRDDQTGLFPELGDRVDAGRDVDGDGIGDFLSAMFNHGAVGLPDQGARVYSGKNGKLLHVFTLAAERRRQAGTSARAGDPTLSWIERFQLAEEALQDAGPDIAIVRLESCLELVPENAIVAYHLACVHARTSSTGSTASTDEALTWLERAVAWGWRDAAVIEWEPDLAPLRARSRFAACVFDAGSVPDAPVAQLELVPIPPKLAPLGIEPTLARALGERGPRTIRAAISPNGRRMFAVEHRGQATPSYATGVAVLYDVVTGAAITVFPRAETTEVASVGFLDDSVAWFLDRARRLYMIDAEGGRTLRILPPEPGMPVRRFAPDHARVAMVTGEAGFVRWWRANSAEPLLEIETGTRLAPDLRLLPDGNVLLTSSERDALQAWDIASGRLLWQRSERDAFWPQPELGPEGALLFETSVGFDAVLVRSGRVALELPLPRARLVRTNALGTLLDGTPVTVIPPRPHRAVSEGKLVRVIDAREMAVHAPTELPREPRFVRSAPDGSKLAAFFGDGDVRVWDARTGEQLCELSAAFAELPGSNVTRMVFDPAAETLVCLTDDWTDLHAFDARTGARRWTSWPGGQWPAVVVTERRVYTSYVALDLATGERVLDSGVEPTHDERRLLGFRHRDPRLVVYDGETLAELYAHSSYDDGEELFHHPTLVHSGGRTALGRAHLRVDGDSFPLDSFATTLYDPRRMRAAAAGVPLRRPRLPEPPVLTRVSPAGRVASATGETATVRAHATSSEDLTGFHLELDGRALARGASGVDVELDGRTGRLAWTIARPESGVAHVSLRAIGRSGTLSRRSYLALIW